MDRAVDVLPVAASNLGHLAAVTRGHGGERPPVGGGYELAVDERLPVDRQLGGVHTCARRMWWATASSSSSMPSPGVAAIARQPSAPMCNGSASMKSRRSGVQPGGS
jgi:hypothetical protein